MKNKHLAYIILPALALSLAGAGIVSAQGWGGGFNASPEEIAERQTAMFERQAEILGLSADQVKSAWAEGKTMREIAEQYGVSQEDIQTRMKTERQEQTQSRLQALVDKGVITQEQAAQRLQAMEERSENMGNGQMMSKGFGRGIGEGRCW